MNEDQQYDAAEREMDLYRAEITRITAQRDEARAERDDYAARLKAVDQSLSKPATDADALAAAVRRAETAEASLAGLESRIGRVIAAVVKAEGQRADAARAKLERVREVIGNFLAEYGDSEIPVFKVAQDLADSLLKIIDPPDGEVPGA